MKAIPCILLFLFAACALQAQEKNYEYYKTILSKGMFPAPPPPPPPRKAEPKYEPPPPNWKINYKVNMVYQHFSSGEISVGVQNIKGDKGVPVNMFLKVGESHEGEGITIEEVVKDEEEGLTVVRISKDGQVEDYELVSSVASPGASAPASRTAASSKGRPPIISRARPSIPSKPAYRRPTPLPRPQVSGKDVQKHLEEYQMEVIRKGLPLLPVSLPDDKIQQLKAEGLAVEEDKGGNQPPNTRSTGSRFRR